MLLAVLGPLGPAIAPEPPSADSGVQWSAPVGCPSASDVRRDIGRLLAPSPRGLDDVRVEGRLRTRPVGYVVDLTIDVDDRVETRSLESDDCVLLARAAALLVAITVDAVATSQTVVQAAGPEVGEVPEPGPAAPSTPLPPKPPSQPEPTPTSRKPERTAAPPTEADTGPGPPRPAWRHGIEAGATGGLGIGLTPGVTGGVEGLLGWRYGPIRLRALGYHWFGRSRLLEPDAGVFAALSGGGVRACYAFAAGRLDVPVCLGPDLAALHGRGVGSAVVDRSARDLWVAAAASVGFEVDLGRRFALVSRIEAVVPVRRPALHLEGPSGPTEVFRAPAAGVRIVLGASVHSKVMR